MIYRQYRVFANTPGEASKQVYDTYPNAHHVSIRPCYTTPDDLPCFEVYVLENKECDDLNKQVEKIMQEDAPFQGEQAYMPRKMEDAVTGARIELGQMVVVDKNYLGEYVFVLPQHYSEWLGRW